MCICEGFAGKLLARPRVMIVATHADVSASVTDDRRSADTSAAIVETIAVKFADTFDVVQRLFVINCQRPTYAELKALRLCLADMRTAIVSVSLLFSSILLLLFYLRPLAQSRRIKITVTVGYGSHSDLNVLVKETAFAC